MKNVTLILIPIDLANLCKALLHGFTRPVSKWARNSIGETGPRARIKLLSREHGLPDRC